MGATIGVRSVRTVLHPSLLSRRRPGVCSSGQPGSQVSVSAVSFTSGDGLFWYSVGVHDRSCIGQGLQGGMIERGLGEAEGSNEATRGKVVVTKGKPVQQRGTSSLIWRGWFRIKGRR